MFADLAARSSSHKIYFLYKLRAQTVVRKGNSKVLPQSSKSLVEVYAFTKLKETMRGTRNPLEFASTPNSDVLLEGVATIMAFGVGSPSTNIQTALGGQR